MKEFELPIVKKQEDAQNWRVCSLLCFDIYSKSQFRKADSHDTRRASDHALRFGQELEVLEHDLTECINEFTMAYRCYYSQPEDLELKKFSIVYHTDNFYVRVHKLIENTYGLLSVMLGMDPTRRPDKKEPGLREQVRERLKQTGLLQVWKIIAAFEGNDAVLQVVKARNLFVHRFREERKWPMLGAGRRYQDDDDSMAKDIQEIEQLPQLDNFAKQKFDEFVAVLDIIRDFRDRLFDTLQKASAEPA